MIRVIAASFTKNVKLWRHLFEELSKLRPHNKPNLLIYGEVYDVEMKTYISDDICIHAMIYDCSPDTIVNEKEYVDEVTLFNDMHAIVEVTKNASETIEDSIINFIEKIKSEIIECLNN